MLNYIWDFDGMLFNSYPHITKAFEIMMTEYGKSIDLRLAQSLFENSFETCYAYYGVTDEMARRHSEVEHLYELFPKAEPFENTFKTLSELSSRGKRQFLYTHRGHDSSQHYLKRYAMSEFFTYCVDSSFDFTPKPAPDGVDFICDKWGLDKAETVMIGDRELDVLAGKNSGTFGCLFTKESIDTSADFVVGDIIEVLDI